MDLDTISHFDIPNERKITKWWPKWVPGVSQNDPKTNKNGHLDLQVPVGCPRGSMDHQNGHSGYTKWSLKVSKMIVSDTKSDPVP